LCFATWITRGPRYLGAARRSKNTLRFWQLCLCAVLQCHHRHDCWVTLSACAFCHMPLSHMLSSKTGRRESVSAPMCRCGYLLVWLLCLKSTAGSAVLCCRPLLSVAYYSVEVRISHLYVYHCQ
jgi:hypothetical protein